jgi:drug/metabolite transporter (DMT)-like permease
VRYAAQELPVIEVAFFRGFFAVIFVLPLVWRGGLEGLRVASPMLHFWRGAISFSGMIFWFTALAIMPLAEAISLNFTAPLWTTLLAALVLRELVLARRWVATAIGFAGVLIVLRPGAEAISLGALYSIIGAISIAINTLMVRVMMRTDNAATVVILLNGFIAMAAGIPTILMWQTPSWTLLGVCIAIGVTSAIAHLAFNRSLYYAEASAMIPLDFLRLPFALVIGLVVFSEWPDAWTIVGGMVIAGSAIYLTSREAAAVNNDARAAGTR